jgi:hypothetical protein
VVGEGKGITFYPRRGMVRFPSPLRSFLFVHSSQVHLFIHTQVPLNHRRDTAYRQWQLWDARSPTFKVLVKRLRLKGADVCR